MRVRPATADDVESVLAVLDAAMLQTDPDSVRDAVADDRAFVAVADDRLLGAVVCVPRETGVHVDAIAVRPGRRGQAIGTALLDTVTDRYDRVTARFDPDVRPFYEGWEIEQIETDRYRAVFEA